MPKPTQPDLFPLLRERDPHPEPPAVGDWHHDWQGLFTESPETMPRPDFEVPRWLRVVGEEGYIEYDHFGRVKK